MKRLILYCSIVLFISACNNNADKSSVSENEVDAARNFIRAALDGKWKEANQFMLQDSTNQQLLDALESNYKTHMKADDKRGYKEATINLYDTRNIFDSVVIIQYSNSYYKNRKDSLKVLRQNGQWFVDLKFSFPQTTAPDYSVPPALNLKDSASENGKKNGAQ